jgi:N-acetylglutamate synthase
MRVARGPEGGSGHLVNSDDLGRRVVVRRVVGVRDGRPLMTDVLGELTAFGDEELTVETKRGPVVIRLADVVAAKRIPPPVRRRSDRG